MEYREREKQKHEAWKVLWDKNEKLDAKGRALLILIEAHYFRAAEQIDSLPKVKRLSALSRIQGNRNIVGMPLIFKVYAGHWLHANVGTIWPDAVTPEVVSLLRLWGYKAEKSPFMQKGMTGYTFPARKKRIK